MISKCFKVGDRVKILYKCWCEGQLGTLISEDPFFKIKLDCGEEVNFASLNNFETISREEEEKPMSNEEELLKSIEETEKHLKELKENLEKQKKKKRKRVPKGSKYVAVSAGNAFHTFTESGDIADNTFFNSGNYFPSVEEAKKSLFYKVLNDDYFYWYGALGEFPLDYIPDGLMLYNYGNWTKSGAEKPRYLDNDTLYRWPK